MMNFIDTYPYKIISKHFTNENETVIFCVYQKESKKIIQLSALNLFNNMELLELFSPYDIRDICLMASQQIQLLEHKQMAIFSAQSCRVLRYNVFRSAKRCWHLFASSILYSIYG